MNNGTMMLGLIATKLGLSPMQMVGMMKFQGLTADSLTPEVVLDMAKTMGFQHPSVDGIMSLVTKAKAEQPSNIFDWLGKEDNLGTLIGALKGEEGPLVVRCPMCRHMFHLGHEA